MNKTRTSIQEKKQAWIDDLIQARRRVLEAVHSLPVHGVDEIFLGTWSVMDLLAHLVGWDFTNLRAVQEILAGQYPSFFRQYDQDWQSYNRQLVEKFRKETLAELLEEVEESHRQLIGYLQGLSAEELVKGKAWRENGGTVSVRSLLAAEASDEGKHAEQVVAFSEQQMR